MFPAGGKEVEDVDLEPFFFSREGPVCSAGGGRLRSREKEWEGTTEEAGRGEITGCRSYSIGPHNLVTWERGKEVGN